MFVANRVQQIRNHTAPEQWQYISTSENHADIASRGATVQELTNSSTWLSGPEFLWKNEPYQPEEAFIESKLPLDDPEVKKAKVLNTLTHDALKHTSVLQRLDGFSDWQRANRVIARCLKYKEALLSRTKKANTPSISIQVTDLQKAETEIVRQVQSTFFEEEIKILSQNVQSSVSKGKVLKRESPLYKLDPFLDDKGVLRVGGRLRLIDLGSETKHPVILPRKSHVTDLVITHFHKSCQHQGRGLTTNTIRANGFWIVGCSSAVSFIISKCVICRKLRNTCQGQKMADLPSDRLEATPPFEYSAVDYFGPWLIKEGRKKLKRYGFCSPACLVEQSI